MVHRHVLPDFRGFPDDDPHPVVDEETLVDRRPRMDLDPREGTGDVREKPGQQPKVVRPEPVGRVVEPHDVEPRVA